MSDPPRARIVVAGPPNAGKTSLFNALTGARARTGNYPGITVDRRTAELTLGETRLELVDVPGTYSLSARSKEEQIAIDEVLPRAGRQPSAAIFVADASALERHLYLALQLLETRLPTILCLNMVDDMREHGIVVDAEALARELGIVVIAVSARTGEGLDRLRAAIGVLARRVEKADGERAGPTIELALPPPLEEALARVELAIEAAWPAPSALSKPRADARRAALARWALLSIGGDELDDVPGALREVVERERREAEAEGGATLEEALVTARYAYVDRVAAKVISRAGQRARASERIDAVLTHPLLGLLAFAAVMAVVFQALFAWSEPMMSGIEEAVATTQGFVRAVMPAGPLGELLVDGVIAGVGNVIVFVPQIAMLSLFIVLLEDSGYLARVAFVIDRVMHGVGLHGGAFVPMLSGFACAVPAIMATRTIANRRDRLVTMMALPLMSCSARLPIYALVTAIVFPPGTKTSIGVEAGALALLSMYALSVSATLGAAAVLKRTILKGETPPLLLELPPYRVPQLGSVARAVAQRTRSFLWDAGTIIAAITVVLWALLSYPRDAAGEAELDARARASAHLEDRAERDEAIEAIEHARAELRMEHSVGGHLGHLMEPLIAPLGFDWKIGIGILASFAAREVFVGTLGIVYGVGTDADETSDSLRDRLRAAERGDGSALFTPLSGVSLMVFFVLAAQCMSTLAAIKRESGSWRWAIFTLVYMNTLAYLAALLVYQGGRLLGFS